VRLLFLLGEILKPNKYINSTYLVVKKALEGPVWMVCTLAAALVGAEH